MEAEGCEKQGRPGNTYHVNDVRWMRGGCREGGVTSLIHQMHFKGLHYARLPAQLTIAMLMGLASLMEPAQGSISGHMQLRIVKMEVRFQNPPVHALVAEHLLLIL